MTISLYCLASIPIPEDICEQVLRPEIHEKCMHASGDVIVWIGYTDERMEGVWADAQPPYDLLPFEGERKCLPALYKE